MKIKIIVYFIFILTIINSVYAQSCGTYDNPCKDNWENFDYGNPNADISKVPPDKIDARKAIAYGRGKELTSSQIKGNFNNIDNLNDLDLTRARGAILDKYVVIIADFGQDTSLKEGILQANFGLRDKATLTSDVYKNGLLRITKNGEIEFIPSLKVINLDIPQGDTLTVRDIQNPSRFKDYTIQGTFKVHDNNALTFLRGEVGIIGGIEINSLVNNVDLCEIRNSCKGNYIFLGEKTMDAQCSSCSLRFREDNKYFQVIEKGIELILPGQNDFLRFDLGNSYNYGRIHVDTEENLPPEIKTDGWVRIVNDDNIVTFDRQRVIKNLFKENFPDPNVKSTRGSVHSAVFADGDNERAYVFDESQNLHILPKASFETLNGLRKDISERYGISFTGYFSATEIISIQRGLYKLEKSFGIDLKKMNIESGGKKIGLNIFEMDDRLRANELAFVSPAVPIYVFWSPSSQAQLKTGGTLVSDNQWNNVLSTYMYVFPHELGHVIKGLSNPYTIEEKLENPSLLNADKFTESYKKLAESSGIKSIPLELTYKGVKFTAKENIDSGPENLFPTDYSKTTLGEHQAEIFSMMVNKPEWFENPYFGKFDEKTGTFIRLNEPVSDKIMKQRRAFRDLFLEELKKYKK